VESALIPDHGALAVLIVSDLDQPMRFAAIRHRNDLELLTGLRVEDIDTALTITGFPHLRAVRREQNVIAHVAREYRVQQAAEYEAMYYQKQTQAMVA
jgi:hypothetical protein